VSQDAGYPEIQSAGKLVTKVDSIKDKVKLYAIEIQNEVVHIKGYVGSTAFSIKAKLSELGKTFVVEPFEGVVLKAQGSVAQVSGKVGVVLVQVKAQGNNSSQKALQACADVRILCKSNIEKILTPIAQAYLNASTRVHDRVDHICEPYIVHMKDGFAYASGRVGNMVISVKAKGQHAKQNAVGAYSSTLEKILSIKTLMLGKLHDRFGPTVGALRGTVQHCRAKVQDGFLLVTGRIDGTRIYLKVKLSKSLETVMVKLAPHLLIVKDSYQRLNVNIDERATKVKVMVADTYCHAKASATSIAHDATQLANAKVAILSSGVHTIVADKRFKTTAGSAIAGGAALGASGGATGFVAGGAVGAVLGVVPAVFTFGLSIPIGAAIGSGAGLCVGTAAGTAVGFVGGGATAYGAQTVKVGKEVEGAVSKIHACKEYARTTAISSTRFLKAKLSGSTGQSDSSTSLTNADAPIFGTGSTFSAM